jgi:hypothetical protein
VVWREGEECKVRTLASGRTQRGWAVEVKGGRKKGGGGGGRGGGGARGSGGMEGRGLEEVQVHCRAEERRGHAEQETDSAPRWTWQRSQALATLAAPKTV